MTTALRIVSLVASATEIVCALGRGESLVGRSHRCDYPPEVLRLPSVTAPKFEDARTGAEIDVRVRSLVRYGLTGGIPFFHRWTVRPLIRDALSIHKVDADVLRALKPDIILTQEHSVASGVSLVDVEAAIWVWLRRPVPVVSLSPRSLADVYGDIGKIAQALGVPTQGGALVRRMQERIAAVESRVAHKSKPSVAFLVWLEPLTVASGWIPALVEAAGGRNLFDKADTDSMRWDEICSANPDVIIVAPFGYNLARCLEERPLLEVKPGWSDLAAVRSRRLYFADGNAYFNRPSPRLADSTEILAEVLHPDISGHRHEGSAWVR